MAYPASVQVCCTGNEGLHGLLLTVALMQLSLTSAVVTRHRWNWVKGRARRTLYI